MRPIAENFPFFCIFLALTAGIVSAVLPGGRAAWRLTLGVCAASFLLSMGVLAYTFGGNLSFTYTMGRFPAPYGNALQAREEFYEDHPEARDTFHIYIIDSHNYTMSYGWPVLEGARMAAAGKEAEEIVSYIQDWVDHARVIFAALDLRFAKKSGRISAAAAFMGEALGLKPVMTFEDGESKILSKVRGEKNVISAIVELCKKERRPDSPILLIRGNNDEQADKLAQACRQELGREPDLTYCIGGVIAINAGPNLVGLLYWD